MALLKLPINAGRLAVLVFTAPLVQSGSGQPVPEYEVKAAYLFNFVKFVAWPPESLGSPSDPLSICTLSDNPFGDALEAALAGKTFSGRPIVSRQVNGAAQARACQILFVSAAAERSFRAMASDLKGAGVLAVGESEGFLSEGGVINFKLDSGHVRLQVNIKAAEGQRLHISAKLLSLADVVKK